MMRENMWWQEQECKPEVIRFMVIPQWKTCLDFPCLLGQDLIYYIALDILGLTMWSWLILSSIHRPPPASPSQVLVLGYSSLLRTPVPTLMGWVVLMSRIPFPLSLIFSGNTFRHTQRCSLLIFHVTKQTFKIKPPQMYFSSTIHKHILDQTLHPWFPKCSY